MMNTIGKVMMAAVVSAGSVAHGALELAPLFTDHMVLQRDMPVPVWGWADAGDAVKVSFAGQEKTAVAGEDGRWRLDLDALEGSFEPGTMTVSSSGGGELALEDVVVGEVWICSGQSNMQFGVNSVAETRRLVAKAEGIRTFEVPKTVALEEQERCGGEWRDRHPSSAVAFGFAYELGKRAKVPVGIVLTCWGSSGIEAWMPRDMVETVPHFRTMMEEFDADEKTRTRIREILEGPRPWPGKDDVFLRRQTNVLYNAMMAPLAPYGARGMVWYQGERNTQSMHGMVKEPWYSRNSGMLKYGDTLKEWIKRYRKEWGREDFRFLVVMLPGYGKCLADGPTDDPERPDAHSWAWLREGQLAARELPHVAVANTIDLGDMKNVHPKDKYPICERLALLAARDVLGEDVVAEGPVMERVEAKGAVMEVSFRNAEGLRTTDGEAPKGFWIADRGLKWVRAEARIRDGRVLLRADGVEGPEFVRYAFAAKPAVNLVNGAGLPAEPFRTDDFVPGGK